jgi:multiple sugar transport system ATP-binding protein
MTVAENIGFHLKVKRVPKDERARRVREAARILDLEPFLDRKPAKLSGGQRQRVAMGRAIVREPQVFLMDEPLSNLDAQLRVQTRTQIAALQRRLNVTTVYVTHDQVEAMTMGDRVAVLDRGELQQCASPKELFTDPVNLFVAGFIGSPQMNLLTAKVGADGAVHGTLTVALTSAQRAAATSEAVTIGVRPEDWQIASDDGAGLQVVVAVVEELGSEAFLYCTEPGTDVVTTQPIVARSEGLSASQPGDRIGLVPRPDRVHLFDTATGARL